MKAKRPALKLPMTKVEWAFEVMTLLAVCLTVGVVAYYWSSFPEQITVHFDLSGKPDGQGPKATLLFLAGITIFDYLLMTVIARFPQTFNYLRPITEKNAASQYLLARKFLSAMKFQVTGILFFAIWSCIQVSIGAADSIDGNNLVILVLVMLLSIGIYMVRASKA